MSVRNSPNKDKLEIQKPFFLELLDKKEISFEEVIKFVKYHEEEKIFIANLRAKKGYIDSDTDQTLSKQPNAHEPSTECKKKLLQYTSFMGYRSNPLTWAGIKYTALGPQNTIWQKCLSEYLDNCMAYASAHYYLGNQTKDINFKQQRYFTAMALTTEVLNLTSSRLHLLSTVNGQGPLKYDSISKFLSTSSSENMSRYQIYQNAYLSVQELQAPLNSNSSQL